MQSKLGFRQVIALVWLITFPILLHAQTEVPKIQDEKLQLQPDTTETQVEVETSLVSEDAIESKIIYKARDSIKYNFEISKVFLHGAAIVTYENIELRAEYIELQMDSNIVYAVGVKDSTGKLMGSPVFKEGGKEFRSQKIAYNFNTKKGKITEVITQEGEGYIHGKDVKKTPDDVIYIRDGLYTTCEHDDPHFSISAGKLKIIPNDKIIARPANLIVEDVNTPIVVPFGIFPNREGGKSGIKVPMPGESVNDGFFLQNGGYYIYLGEKADLDLELDLYTKGAYTFRPTFNYKKRYKRSGTLQGRYKRTITGVVPEDPIYSVTQDYWVNWVHRQEAQAHPNTTFSANVDLGTTTSQANDINTSDNDYLRGNFNSSISFSKNMFQRKLNLNMFLRHNQNNGTGAMNMDLPDLSLTLARIYPFKSKNSVGEKWYHKIGLSYSGNFKNQVSIPGQGIITETDTVPISIGNKDAFLDEFRNGIKHSIPLAMNFKLLKYFTVTPSVNYSEVWYFKSLEQEWNPVDSIVEDTDVPGFVRGGNGSGSVNMTTKIYGIMQMKKGYLRAFRHVITPGAGFTYTPENRQGLISYVDSAGKEIEYSKFKNGIFGTPDRKESGTINFSLMNSFEAKVKTKSDTAGGIKKIKPLENLRLSTGYDIVKDSLKWNNIALSGYTNLTEHINLNFGSSYSLYSLSTFNEDPDSVYTVNKFMWDKSKSLARMTSANAGVTFNFSAGSGDKKKRNKGDDEDDVESLRRDYYDVQWDVPWTINMTYSVTYDKLKYVSSFTQSLNFNGNLSLTKNWKVDANGYYNFERQDIEYLNVGIIRNLHCWEMSINWTPIAPANRQSYNFNIRVTANVLEALKYDKRGF